MFRAIITFLVCLVAVVSAPAQSTPDLETTMCPGDTAVMTVSVQDADSLQWYRNGLSIPGANNDTLVAKLGGIYYLRAFHAQCDDISGDIRIFTAYPRVYDDYATVPLGSLLTLDVLANDKADCAPFDPSSFTIVAQPTLGTLVSAAGGKVVYRPPSLTLGTDKFKYKITDAEGREAGEATVFVTLFIECAIVYPNPVTNKLNIRVSNDKIHAIELYDGLGRALYHSVVSNTMLTIDMSPFAQGFYVLKLLEQGGPGCTVKVQKQ